MPGKAKSQTRKARDARVEHEMLIQQVAQLYAEEQEKPAGERIGLRHVCHTVSEQYHREKGYWVSLAHNTVLAHYNGRTSLSQARENQSWLTAHLLTRDDFYSLRVVHGFGQSRGFCHAGPTGTGPVSDLLTRANTVPVTGYMRVSATGSHARRERCVCLAPPVTHFKGKSPLPPPSLTVDHPTPSRPRRLERAVSRGPSQDGWGRGVAG